MGDGIIGVDNIDRWPLDSEAFGFLEATSSAQSVDVLIKASGFLVVLAIAYSYSIRL
jgi:hypothetical protein